MFYFIVFFFTGLTVGACVGALIMAAIASGKDRDPRWSDYWSEKH